MIMIVLIGVVATLLVGLYIVVFPSSRLTKIFLAPTWPRTKVQEDAESRYRLVGLSIVLVGIVLLLVLLL